MELELIEAEELYINYLKKMENLGINIKKIPKASFGKSFTGGPYIKFENSLYIIEFLDEKSGKVDSIIKTNSRDELMYYIFKETTYGLFHNSQIEYEEAFKIQNSFLSKIGILFLP
jgi:hypothetical protein